LEAADQLEQKNVSVNQHRPFLDDDSVQLTRLRRREPDSDTANLYCDGPRFDFNEDDEEN
jgi:hypothetical protein